MKKTYNTRVVNTLAQKYEVSPRFVRYCLSGERTPIYSDELKSEYERILKKIENALNNN